MNAARVFALVVACEAAAFADASAPSADGEHLVVLARLQRPPARVFDCGWLFVAGVARYEVERVVDGTWRAATIDVAHDCPESEHFGPGELRRLVLVKWRATDGRTLVDLRRDDDRPPLWRAERSEVIAPPDPAHPVSAPSWWELTKRPAPLTIARDEKRAAVDRRRPRARGVGRVRVGPLRAAAR